MKLILEANRKDLIQKGKKGDSYSIKNQKKGKNRFERKKYSKIATNVAQYNQIDMNMLFKKDILTVGINVTGETDNYVVRIKFGGILKELQKILKQNNKKLEFKDILISLTRVFNSDNVYVSCSCKDWRYRQAYSATKDGYNSGIPELRPSDITNPRDSKGSGCKHVALVIANVDWIMKVSSVINNYIHYAEDHLQRIYADFIFPAIYGIPYNKAIQLNIFDFDTDELDTTQGTLDIANKLGRTRTQFKPGEDSNSVNPRFRKAKQTPTSPQKGPTLFDQNNNENTDK